MNLRTLLILTLSITLLAACEEDEKNFLQLEKETLTADAGETSETIALETNGAWHVKDVPEWITIEPMSGESSVELHIHLSENEEYERRNATVTFVGGEASQTLQVEQLGLNEMAPFLKLSQTEMSVDLNGGTYKIQVESNRRWQVTDFPNWIYATPLSGDKSGQVTFEVSKTTNPERREATIEFTADGKRETLTIRQPGLKDVIRNPLLSVIPFKKATYSTMQKYWTIETSKLFINPPIKNKIYVGNLISHNIESNTDIPEITGYTFNPITVSTSAPLQGAKTYIPSPEKQAEYVRSIIAQRPQQHLSMRSGRDNPFYSYDELHAIGMASIGIKLDEIVTGSSFREKKMTKKYGGIFSFRQELFTVDMDLPDQLINGDMKESDLAKGASYIASMSYGRVALLIVETDDNYFSVRTAIETVWHGGNLLERDRLYLANADITCVYFNNDNELQVKKGNNMEVIDTYQKILNDTNNIYPIFFQAARFIDNEIPVVFTYEVPHISY